MKHCNRNKCSFCIKTQKNEYTVHSEDGSKDVYTGEQNKTFWIICTNCDYEQRFSIDSCPKWVKRIYKQLTGG